MSINPSRRADGMFGIAKEAGTLLAEPYLGLWLNTDPATKRVRKLLIETHGTDLSIQLWGASEDGLVDWGIRPAEAYVCTEENGVEAASVFASYDFGFMCCDLQLRLNKGILPMMSWSRFRDDSGRSNTYVREFFYRASAGGTD